MVHGGGMVYSGELASRADQSGQQGDSKVRREQQGLSTGAVGLRDRLESTGIFVWASYTADLLGNPSGGRGLAFRYAKGLEIGLKFDLERPCCSKDTPKRDTVAIIVGQTY